MTDTPLTDGQRRERLVNALLSAFDSKAALGELVDYALNTRLAQITDGDNLRVDVFNLVIFTDSNGITDKLVCKAVTMRPGNEPLREVARIYGCPEPLDAEEGDRQETPRPPDGGHEQAPIHDFRTALGAIGWLRIKDATAISVVVVMLELLNRFVVHLLVLYPTQGWAGTLSTIVAVGFSCSHVLRLRARRWWPGAVAWVIFILLFIGVDYLLRRGSFDHYNPEAMQPLLALLYAGSFGALTYTFITAYDITKPR